ncbi:uroporphyrinogen-III C-methyltransferase [Salipaludibacillus neizhouensis]|uniref:uroporphyrinogen-III C-methyltransferase n=1 Tax=Salipaludibacillus neizhouensis TaxID=885475 RepID=UPI001CBA665A|nr:uroporphyrinogen-III C-methyltransferase [Salipaludibacillus neizhouensis]
MYTSKGEVYLVGAGPGDPKLLTLRGAELLQEADVIVYDRLVNKEILKHGKTGVELILCGKSPTGPSTKQEEINEILVFHGLQGKKVVRLKGGDPAIFGRVSEEAIACRENGIHFEIVPGITSGIAAPAYAGIPLTHRELSTSFAIVTGHQRKNGKTDEINWKSLATSVDTLVFYMGVSQIKVIQDNLLFHGLSPTTPVALVRWGTYPTQETLTGELLTIAEKVNKRKFKSPAIIIVGEVVRLREKLAWFEEKLDHSSHFNES